MRAPRLTTEQKPRQPRTRCYTIREIRTKMGLRCLLHARLVKVVRLYSSPSGLSLCSSDVRDTSGRITRDEAKNESVDEYYRTSRQKDLAEANADPSAENERWSSECTKQRTFLRGLLSSGGIFSTMAAAHLIICNWLKAVAMEPCNDQQAIDIAPGSRRSS